jgi:ubiquinone/menaquinone biosynthesis C-methylase UbiE
MKFEPTDRLLLLDIPTAKRLESLSDLVPQGAVVAMGIEEEVLDMRQQCRHLPNVMIHPGTVEEIPWGTAQFHHVLLETNVCSPQALKEIWRVLVPDGLLSITIGAETLQFQRKITAP